MLEKPFRPNGEFTPMTALCKIRVSNENPSKHSSRLESLNSVQSIELDRILARGIKEKERTMAYAE